MATDEVRSSIASHTFDGMGLPDSSRMPAPSQALQGSSPVISTLSRPGSSSPKQKWLATANRGGALSNGALSGCLVEDTPVSAVACAHPAAVPRTSTGATVVVSYPSASSVPALRGNTSRDYRAGYPQEALSLSTLQSSQNLSQHHIPRARHGSERGTGAPPVAPSQKRTSLDAGAQGGDVNTPQDFRGGRQSITVLRVTHDGAAQESARSPSSGSAAQAGSGGSTPVMCGVPAQPPRMAIVSRRSSAAPLGSSSPRVHVESMAPITPTVLTKSTVHTAMPQAVAAAEFRQRPPLPQPQRASLSRPPRSSGATSTPPPNHRPQPRASPSASVPSAAKATQPAPFPMPPSTTIASPAAPSPNNGSRPPLQPMRGASRSPERPTAVVSATVNNDAALQCHPSRNRAMREAGKPLLTGPATLQVSTTTLTTTIKKVRYLLPDEPFDPDAPDPSDIGGPTAEEETALLDPVNYTCAVHEVAGRYPMRLRRLSAQGGDLLRDLHGSGGDQRGDGASHPTFLLDDGNRWVRTTNRPALATTRDPSGTVTPQLPVPPILPRAGVASKAAATATNGRRFPAHQRVAAHAGTARAPKGEEASGYLLQRHVQQTATGNRLVKGSVFEPPSVEKKYAERHREKHDEDQLSAAAVAQPGIENEDKDAHARPPQRQYQRRGTMEDLYDEILRRTQQHRRSALPATVLPSAASPQALPVPPPRTTARAAPPTTKHRGWRPHLSSARPASLDGGYRGSPGAAPPPRSSSQPYIPIDYRDEGPSGSEVSSLDKYPTPLTYSAPQPQQQASTPLDGTGAAANDSAWPRLPSSIPHPHLGARQQQRQVMPPSHSSSMSRDTPQLPGRERPVTPKVQLGNAPPRRPKQQEQQPASRYVTQDFGAAAALHDGSQMPKYTSGRFGDHNDAVLVPPSPPAGDLDHFYSSSSGSPHNSVPGLHGPRPPPPAQAPPSRRITEHASSADVVPPPPANSGEPRLQSYEKQLSSSYGNAETDEWGCNAATLDSYYPDDETVLDGAFADNTMTDVASMHTTRRHSSADHIDGTLASDCTMPAFGVRDAVEKAHRPLLEPYSRSTQVQEAAHSSNGNASSLQHQGQARPHRETCSDHRTQGSAPLPPQPPPAASAAASSSTRQRAAEGGAVHSRNGSSNAGHAATLRPPAATASVAAQAAHFEARTSSDSCDTDTQPVTVSERSENDLGEDEDDGLLKKQPPLLVLGDEVFAPEGYEYVEEGDECDGESTHHVETHLELERKH
ncbi:hypothetical protein GH5_07711 [Leishmania sp. Ghana 2012 LV757]|uniref:hypothetical protein n=1 Tax=Leishmania sp. Ghana 2012 LV757 TaxID=2803181 RepID=UPI001B527FE7|nr:hypothetical protein GH5_07711 [Leishmania sp. Ghana 2012 LV757]